MKLLKLLASAVNFIKSIFIKLENIMSDVSTANASFNLTKDSKEANVGATGKGLVAIQAIIAAPVICFLACQGKLKEASAITALIATSMFATDKCTKSNRDHVERMQAMNDKHQVNSANLASKQSDREDRQVELDHEYRMAQLKSN